MPTAYLPNPIRRALLASALCLGWAIGARAQSFPDRIHRITAPAADSAGGFRGVARWGGRLFLLYEAACFWSSDGGRAWARQDFTSAGPKGPVPGLPGGGFTASADGLWLNRRGGALAWRFDPAAGAWRPWDAGATALAAAGSGDRLYALTPDHRLRLTRNAGDTWEEIPLPAAVREGTFFEEMQAESEHLAMHAGPADALSAAYSLDGGAHWGFLAPASLPLLAHGRLYAFGDSLRILAPAGEAIRALPAHPARAAFADSGGGLFPLCDSGLYALEPASGGGWKRIADAQEMRLWSLGRGIAYRWEGRTLAWFDGLPEATDGIRLPGKPRRAAGTAGADGSPRFVFFPDGSPVPGIGIPGGMRDPLGRRIP